MKVSLIVAAAQNFVIGKDNDLIWYLPKDLQFFKKTTENHVVIMGRKNYLSIPEKYRPLPNRTNVVVTRQEDFTADNCIIKHSIESALEYAKAQGETEAFIIGGGQVYKYAMDHQLVDRMYITWLEKSYEGDTYFPSFSQQNWKVTSKVKNEADSRHETGFTFTVYDRDH